MKGYGIGPVFKSPFATAPSQIYAPVRAQDHNVLDNGGDLIAQCFTPEMAQHVAKLLNKDAGL